MTDEQVRIIIGTGKDKVTSIEESTSHVVITFQTPSGIERPITIERKIINDVLKIIQEMEIGEPYKSKYIHNKLMELYNVKSKIIEDRMDIIKETLSNHKLPEVTICNIIDELENNDKFMMLQWEEHIGSRTKDSFYFKVYGACRYWAEKNLILYTSNGGITRLE